MSQKPDSKYLDSKRCTGDILAPNQGPAGCYISPYIAPSICFKAMAPEKPRSMVLVCLLEQGRPNTQTSFPSGSLLGGPRPERVGLLDYAPNQSEALDHFSVVQ